MQCNVFYIRSCLRSSRGAGRMALWLRDGQEKRGGHPVSAGVFREKEYRAVLCRECGHTITFSRAVLAVDGSSSHTFFNPAGILFEIICFSKAPGCVVQGPPSIRFTWFSGFTWRLAFCGGCLTHAGWLYESGESAFFGLIGNKLTGDI